MSSQQPKATIYRGRFAPSPTGPLHFGSLIAAVGSYLQARTHKGEWLLRIEDIDPPREQKGAAEHIIKTLIGYGFEWSGEVHYQGRRQPLYQAALERLIEAQHCFACNCSRKKIRLHSESLNLDPQIYPGICRERSADQIRAKEPNAIRVKVVDRAVVFHDILQGRQQVDLISEVGDFIVLRADGLYAYQLAVVVDDAEQGITEVARGGDLLAATAYQYYLQQLLGYPHPDYLHLPLVINPQGEKLSKQSYARAIEIDDASANLVQALRFLGQSPEPDLARATTADLWDWAFENWHIDSVPPGSRTLSPERV